MMTAKQGILYEPEVTGVCPGPMNLSEKEREWEKWETLEGSRWEEKKDRLYVYSMGAVWVEYGSFSSVSDPL